MNTAPSLLILGTDAVLAAVPSTAVQLTHACLAVGYDAVVPASWGDELIAQRALERVRHANGPLVQCSCPTVAQRLAPHGDAIAGMLMCLVSPPVATASYLRALYAPARPRIAYAGACAGAASETIDEWFTPDALLALIASRGISIAAQPREFDARLAPDRRRFHSDPGGVPVVSALRDAHASAEYREVAADDFVASLAGLLLGREPALVDASGALGCACSGVLAPPDSARAARARVREHEPPRAPGPVLEDSVRVALDAALPARPSPVPVKRMSGPDTAADAEPREVVAVAAEPPRRRSPTGTRKSILGGMPQTRTDVGRQLPRAYVARRRSSPKGVAAQRGSAPGIRQAAMHWPYIAAAGIGIGLTLAWLVGLAR